MNTRCRKLLIIYFSLETQGCVRITWLKYSSAIRLVHSIQFFSGRVGLDTSAHLIIILFTKVTFSGNKSTGTSKTSEKD